MLLYLYILIDQQVVASLAVLWVVTLKQLKDILGVEILLMYKENLQHSLKVTLSGNL
jgi:hypothetical protein